MQGTNTGSEWNPDSIKVYGTILVLIAPKRLASSLRYIHLPLTSTCIVIQ